MACQRSSHHAKAALPAGGARFPLAQRRLLVRGAWTGRPRCRIRPVPARSIFNLCVQAISRRLVHPDGLGVAAFATLFRHAVNRLRHFVRATYRGARHARRTRSWARPRRAHFVDSTGAARVQAAPAGPISARICVRETGSAANAAGPQIAESAPTVLHFLDKASPDPGLGRRGLAPHPQTPARNTRVKGLRRRARGKSCWTRLAKFQKQYFKQICRFGRI